MLKNILIVNSVYFPDMGGSGILAHNFAHKLSKLNYNVSVFSGGSKDSIDNDCGVKIYRNDIRKVNSPLCKENYNNESSESLFLEVIKKEKISIVHFNSVQGLGANLVELSLSLGLKTIVTMHDFWWVCPFLFLNDEYLNVRPIGNHSHFCTDSLSRKFLDERSEYLKKIINNKNLFITTVSKTMKEALKSSGLNTNKEITVIENGVDDLIFEDIRSSDNKKKYVFAYFGGENSSKGFDLIFKAAKFLKFNSNDFMVKCFGINNPDIKKIINWKILGSSNIKLYKRYQYIDIQNLMNDVDCVLVPSQVFESYSLIAREALECGKIVISSNMGALSEIESPRHITFSKTSSVDLAKKMYLVLKNHKNILSKKNKFKTLKLSEQIKHYIKLYES